MLTPIHVSQFDKGRYDGRVNERGVIMRTLHTRRVKLPIFGLYSAPIKWHTYSYVEYNGAEYEVRWEDKTWNGKEYVPEGRWILRLHGDDVLVPELRRLDKPALVW